MGGARGRWESRRKVGEQEEWRAAGKGLTCTIIQKIMFHRNIVIHNERLSLNCMG